MKKTLLLVFMLAFCLQPSSSKLAQSAAKIESRVVKDQVLTSTYLPPIRINFDNRFKYIGTQKFILYERAQVEQFFFVEADSRRRIKRMYFAQFEGYLPGVDANTITPSQRLLLLQDRRIS